MKQLLYLLLFLFTLASCQQEEPMQGEGYLSLSAVTVQSAQVVSLSRTADDEEPLDLRILKDGEVYESYEYAPGTEIPKGFKLPVGDYEIEAYNAAYFANEADKAMYYVKKSFTIEAGKLYKEELSASLYNFGVSLSLPDDFNTFFKDDYTFEVTVGDRTVTLKNGETAYFAFAEGATISYKLSVTNSDNESHEDEVTYPKEETEQVNRGTIYCVTYKMEGRSISSVVQ